MAKSLEDNSPKLTSLAGLLARLAKFDNILPKLKYRFTHHRSAAKARGIPFQLSFAEWVDVWARSGKYEKCGCRRGQYVMSRPGDRGSYAVGHVKIVSALANRLERRPESAARNSVSCVAKHRAAKLGKKRPPFSKQWRNNISKSQSRRRAREATYGIA